MIASLDRSTGRALGFITAALLVAACGRESGEAGGTRETDSAPGLEGSPGASVARDGAGVVTSADGVRIAYESQGQGQVALVFVHGWSCDRSYWAAQAEGPALTRQYRVVTVDLAGHGDSGAEREAWTIPAFGGDVAAVVEGLRLQRVILIGHSMGGDVSVEAARRMRERVAGLVWVDVYKQLGTPRTAEQVRTFMATFRDNFPDATRTFARSAFGPRADSSLVNRVAADMASAPPAIALPALEAAITYDREMPKALAELRLPVIAINPDSPPTDIPSLERHGLEVVRMPNVGHFPMMEDPTNFNALLGRVIERILR